MSAPQFPAPGSTPIALSRRTHERHGDLRVDEAWLESAWADERTRVLPMAGNRFPVVEDGDAAVWSSADRLPATGVRAFLGLSDGVAHFALLDSDPPEDPAQRYPDLDPAPARWVSMRAVMAGLSEPDIGYVVHAVALAEWHAATRFCPRCGSRLHATAAGHVLACEQCGRQQFPRTDPAVIMLVLDGDRALLGRSPAWPEGRFSTLAGFVEPGESLEDAVVREVAEESSVVVGEVGYFGNQPWPFPQSLMVGFFAHALDPEVHVDGDEVVDARWFTREELRAQAEDGSVVLPGGISISRSLIEAWYGEPLPGSW